MKIIKEIIPYLIIILLVVLLRTFIVTPVLVDGTSMSPTLKNNQVLLLKKYDKSFTRFEVIVFKYEQDDLVKRVIGLPGEHVKYVDNKLYIDNKEVEDVKLNIKTNNFDLLELGYDKIPENYYFVLGDNRTNSSDSRMIGLISKKQIKGSTNFSLYPFNHFGVFNKY